MLCGISPAFAGLFPTGGQIAHVLRTRAPCAMPYCYGTRTRLACVKHAASVRSEPGSNSRLKPVAWAKKNALIFIRASLPKQIVDRSMLLNHSGSKKAEWFRTDSGTSYQLSKSRASLSSRVATKQLSEYGGNGSGCQHLPERFFSLSTAREMGL